MSICGPPENSIRDIDNDVGINSDRSASESAKTVKNALNPPLTGDEDSQGDDNIGGL